MALFEAVSRLDVCMVRASLDPHQANREDIEGNTPLHRAIDKLHTALADIQYHTNQGTGDCKRLPMDSIAEVISLLAGVTDLNITTIRSKHHFCTVSIRTLPKLSAHHLFLCYALKKIFACAIQMVIHLCSWLA